MSMSRAFDSSWVILSCVYVCLCVFVCLRLCMCLHLCMRLCVSVQTTVKEGIRDLVPYTVTVLRPVEAVPLFWCPGVAAPEPGSLSCEHLTGWQTGLAAGPGSAQEEPPWRPIQAGRELAIHARQMC